MKILLVEDEIDIANFLTRGLRYEGFEVFHAKNGDECLKMIKKDDYDVVVLDLLLPGMNGEEVVKEVRKDQNTVPVIVLTAINDTETKIRLLNAGADDFLVKPFSFVELNARIKSVLRRSNPHEAANEELKLKDLVLIPGKRLVIRGGKRINLRSKEFSLLAYMMRQRNKVISRNTLVEQVWDYNAKIKSNTVDSHVSLLRKKINDGFDEELIETLHGIGYILRDEDEY